MNREQASTSPAARLVRDWVFILDIMVDVILRGRFRINSFFAINIVTDVPDNLFLPVKVWVRQ